jgi:hypothetical protein
MPTRTDQPQFTRMKFYKIKIPVALHEDMRTIWTALKKLGGDDLKLWRVYLDALEQFVNARQQQQLLKEGANNAPRKTKGASGD